MKHCSIIFVLVWLCCWPMMAQHISCADADSVFNKTIDSDADDFVIAHLVIAEPGEVLYSCAGHACIRLQCPEHGLDFCFSYESEDVQEKVFSFLAGKLKMGMMAIPTERYISGFAKEGRGVYQYRLNLPLDAKKRLWELADNRLMQGTNLAYDYLHRGCAITCRQLVDEALYPKEIDYNKWPEKYINHARSDLLAMAIDRYPWDRFFIRTISGTDGDSDCQMKDKLVVPADLLEMWQQASVDGKPLLASRAEVLSPSTKEPHKHYWCSPILIACLILMLAALGWWKHGKFVDIMLLALQVAMGLFLSYLVFVSNLVCTNWTWLLIPFNPLPIITWHWRRYWVMPYAIILVIWSVVMTAELLLGNWKVDPAHIIWTMAIVLNYLSIRYRKK